MSLPSGAQGTVLGSERREERGGWERTLTLVGVGEQVLGNGKSAVGAFLQGPPQGSPCK